VAVDEVESTVPLLFPPLTALPEPNMLPPPSNRDPAGAVTEAVGEPAEHAAKPRERRRRAAAAVKRGRLRMSRTPRK
jgi:hypothetical protein